MLHALKQLFLSAGTVEQFYAYTVKLCRFLIQPVQSLKAGSHQENIKINMVGISQIILKDFPYVGQILQYWQFFCFGNCDNISLLTRQTSALSNDGASLTIAVRETT